MRGITAPQSHQLQCSDAAMGWVTKNCYPWSMIPFKDPIVSTTFNQLPTSFYLFFLIITINFVYQPTNPQPPFTLLLIMYTNITLLLFSFFYDGDVYIYLQLTYVKTLSKSLMFMSAPQEISSSKSLIFMSAPQEISSSTSVGSIGSPQEMLNSSIGGALR